MRLIRACLLVVLTIPFAVGCSDAPGAICGVVVDTTSYAKEDLSKADIAKELPPFGAGCDWIAFSAVTGRSEGSLCKARALSIAATSRENPNGNPKIEEAFRKHRLKETVDSAGNLLTTCPTEGSGSDVLGALRDIARQMNARKQAAALPYRLIVFSDLINNRGELDVTSEDLSQDGLREQKIKNLLGNRLLPDLNGYEVTVVGFVRGGVQDPDKVPALTKFWEEAFEACGASADLL